MMTLDVLLRRSSTVVSIMSRVPFRLMKFLSNSDCSSLLSKHPPRALPFTSIPDTQATELFIQVTVLVTPRLDEIHAAVLLRKWPAWQKKLHSNEHNEIHLHSPCVEHPEMCNH